MKAKQALEQEAPTALVDGVPNAEEAIAYALKRWGYRQGTKECVAFYRGACWLQLASQPLPGRTAMSNDILRELAACKASDPYRTKAWIPHMRGKWMTVNVPAELWGRIQAAARPPECVGKDPRGCWNVRCQLDNTCCRAHGVAVDAKPIDARQLKQTLEAATRCLQRNDWGTAFDRVQDALALLPDGVAPSDGGQQ